jgi:preprotein translocase subunit Sec61beta
MVDKNKLRSPTGAAGLVRYEEGAESKIVLEPRMVIAIGVAVVVLEVLLFLFF